MHGLNGETRREKVLRALAGGFAILLLALAAAPAASAQGYITNLSPDSWNFDGGPFTLLVTVANLPAGTHTIWFNGTALQTTDVSPTQVQGSVTDISPPGVVDVYVQTHFGNIDEYTASVTFTVIGPTITLLSPAAVVAGHAQFTLTVTGTGFYTAFPIFNSVLTFGAHTLLNPPLTGTTQIQATIPAAWVATPGTVYVQYSSGIPGNFPTGLFPFTIASPLQLVSTSMPSGLPDTPYDFTFQAINGIPPLTFAATGLPGNVSINPATGEVTGSPNGAAIYHVTLVVTDSVGETVTGQFTLNVTAPLIPPLAFIGSAPAAGQVGVPYSSGVGATGGVPPYTFGLAGGTLPAGLTIYASGAIGGTPTAAGTSNFTLRVTDSAGSTATQGYSIAIAPPALTITTGALSNAPAGTPLTIVFSATGGYPGYSFSLRSEHPAGHDIQ